MLDGGIIGSKEHSMPSQATPHGRSKPARRGARGKAAPTRRGPSTR